MVASISGNIEDPHIQKGIKRACARTQKVVTVLGYGDSAEMQVTRDATLPLARKMRVVSVLEMSLFPETK